MSRTSRIVVFATGTVIFLAIAPLIGGTPLDWREIFQPSSPSYRIVFDLRLPRVFLALMVGGSLAMLGATYQIMFHNPLAEPYILGVSSAVIVGVAIGETCFGIPAYSVPGTVIGFLSAMAVTSLMLLVYLSRMGQAVHRLILFGMGIQFILSSVLFLTLSYFSQHLGGGTLRWLFGQIPWLETHKIVIFSMASVPFLIFLFLHSRHLDALNLGDSVSRTLGYSPLKSRAWLLVMSSAFVAMIVSFTGAIGFVGLVVPHVTRLIFRPASTRALFGIAFLIGSCFLVLSDILSRIIMPPFEFPIGILTTILGGPIFLYLLWKR